MNPFSSPIFLAFLKKNFIKLLKSDGVKIKLFVIYIKWEISSSLAGCNFVFGNMNCKNEAISRDKWEKLMEAN